MRHTNHETACANSNACLCRFAAATVCIKLRGLLSMRLMSDKEHRPFGIAAVADLSVKNLGEDLLLTMQFWQLSGNTANYTQLTCLLNPSSPSV